MDKSFEFSTIKEDLKVEDCSFIIEKSDKIEIPNSVKLQKGENSIGRDDDSSINSIDSCNEGSTSFSGVSHPLEPIDSDLMSSIITLSLKDGPFIEEHSINIPSVETALESNESKNVSLEERECVWDASLPPSGNVSPLNSIDASIVGTTISFAHAQLKACTTCNIAKDNAISKPLESRKTSVDSATCIKAYKNSESAKESAIGDSLGSTKTSISRASDSSIVSDDSSWSSSVIGSSNRPHKGNDPRWKAIMAIKSRDGNLGMGHFRLLRKLGCGDIGSVYLSELSGTKCYFAMKVMDKTSLASRKKLARAQTERDILKILDHPFLPTLYTNFETDRFTCLVMEYCPGGDLHTLRQRQSGKHFSEYAARFYVAEILLALEYLHMLGIVYRDLKPENVLVRQDGHIMLSDFDLSLRCSVSPTLLKTLDSSDPTRALCINPSSSCLQPSCFFPRLFPHKSKKSRNASKFSQNHELVAEPTSARSMSFVGTHEYLAPEIIKGEGHGSAVDWWTFGIFLYELVYGKTPFKGAGNRATLFNVVGQQLRFPEGGPSISHSCRDLIRGLLTKEPQHRLGVKRGATEIKQHPFFEEVNWVLIRCSTPPVVPRCQMEVEVEKRVEGALSKRMVKSEAESGGKFLDFEFF